jgi:hypothetical protein
MEKMAFVKSQSVSISYEFQGSLSGVRAVEQTAKVHCGFLKVIEFGRSK